MNRRKIATILWATALLLLTSFTAQAQDSCNIGTFWGYTGDVEQAGSISLLQWEPQLGFSAYSCPAPPAWVSKNISQYWGWLSTCLSGSNYIGLVEHTGSIDTPSQINMANSLFNPFNQQVQAEFSAFAYAADTNPPGPVWVPIQNSGGPCGPNS